MPSLVKGGLINRTASVLDRVDFDFVLSVGKDDGLAHDFGLVVNRVSRSPTETTDLLGRARTVSHPEGV